MRISFKEFANKRNALVTEAFKEEDMYDAFMLIRDSLNKHCKRHITIFSGTINTKVDDEYMTTKYYLVGGNGNVKMFGLNFLRSERSNHIYSIDFFDSYDVLFNDPGVPTRTSLSIYTLGSSVVYFLPVIWTIVNNDNTDLDMTEITDLGKKIFVKECKQFEFSVGSLIYYITENLNNINIKNYSIVEKRNIRNARDFGRYKADQKADAYKHRHDSKESADSYKRLLDEVKEVWDAIRGGAMTLPELKAAIKRNVQVITEIDELTREQEKELNVAKEDPEAVFKKMRNYVRMVIKGINNSVILCGAPGVGKTYNVHQMLRAAGYKEGINLCNIKGRCSARQLYCKLYEYRNKGDIIVIDDADSLVGPHAPEDCINILKGALDTTSDDKGRFVMYGVAGRLTDDDGDIIPKSHYYNGSIIIITNYNAGSLDTALRGRSFVQDICFDTESLLKIVKRIMPAIDPIHLSSRAKIKAYDYLDHLAKSGSNMEISIRTFGICAKIYETCLADPDFSEEEAEQMIAEQMEIQSRRMPKNTKY